MNSLPSFIQAELWGRGSMLLLETRRKDKQTRWSAVAASDGALIAHKPAVCGRDFPIACLRTASRASTASNRGGNVFFSANASICSRKIPEMTYTPSFLMKASFFRYFVNALGAVKEQQKFFHSPCFLSHGFQCSCWRYTISQA